MSHVRRRAGLPGPVAAKLGGSRHRSEEFDSILRLACADSAFAVALLDGYRGLHERERRALRAAVDSDVARLGLTAGALQGAMAELEAKRRTDPFQAFEDEETLRICLRGDEPPSLILKEDRVFVTKRAPAEGRRVPLAPAVFRVSEALWRMRERGQRWPGRLRMFADLFG